MMRRTCLAGTIVAACAVAAPAQADANAATKLRAHYQDRYTAVAKQLGTRAPGRNIVKYGMRDGDPATRREIRRSIVILDRMLAPPPAPVPVVAPSSSTPAPPPAASSPGGGGPYSIPSDIVMCESGGDYGAYNPSSGAGGAYQILPSTWEAYGGTGSPHTASKEEQDRVAARVWAGQGRGAWVC